MLNTDDPVPFDKYAMQEEQDHFTEHGYISLSGHEWEHERPQSRRKNVHPGTAGMGVLPR